MYNTFSQITVDDNITESWVYTISLSVFTSFCFNDVTVEVLMPMTQVKIDILMTPHHPALF